MQVQAVAKNKLVLTILNQDETISSDAEAAIFPIASASDPRASTAWEIILHNFMS